MIWSLYLATFGQAIPSSFGPFILAQTPHSQPTIKRIKLKLIIVPSKGTAGKLILYKKTNVFD